MLNSHQTKGNIMPPESFLELIPDNLNIGKQGIPIMTPPDACITLQLVGSILCLHAFSKPKQAKLLLNGI
jgi:hypothetical protein